MYDVLEYENIEDLIEAVNEKMKDGWKPTGGIQVLHYEWTNERKGYTESSTNYFQAIVKSE